MMRIGQCHRYAEYERDPSHWNGAYRKNDTGAQDVAVPPAIAKNVDMTGTKAHGPGNFVVSEKVATLMMIPARPHHDNAADTFFAAFVAATGNAARSAPIANSNARVCGEKNAHGCD